MIRSRVVGEPRLETVTSLEDFYQIAGSMRLSPGWRPREKPILVPRMASKYRAAHWSYEAVRTALEAAGRLIDVALAERRNLLLVNDSGDNDWATSRTLVCAYQMILPGEFAPSHRHTGNALRVIMEGEGSFSVVEGERMPMETGDVVLTPGGYWHGHGHDGDRPAFWLDCLDVPFSYLIETMQFEPPVDRARTGARDVGKSPFRFSRGEIERALDNAIADPEGRFGASVVLPTPSMPSIGLLAQRLPSGLTTRSRRTTANRLFAVMAGSGATITETTRMDWSSGDTVFIPGGVWFEHHALNDAQLLDMSDEPIMRFSNHYAEELA